MRIFDRWGELIFESKDINQGWNGTYNGENSPDGVYVWKIRYVDIENQIPQEIIGHVTLLR
jgi:gliding motility-associated-like protein